MIRNWWTVVPIVILFSCESSQTSQSDLKHTVGQPVLTESRFQWHESPYELFEQQAGEELLPRDHPANERLQAWHDRYHQMLKEEFPQQMANVARPKSVIAVSDDVNAFVTTVLAGVGKRFTRGFAV